MSDDAELRENNSIKINATNTWTNNNDRNVRIQVLNIHEVEFVTKDNRAKGDRSINIFTIIYLMEYENNRFTNPKEKKLSNIPFSEKRLKISEWLFMQSDLAIKLLKEISWPEMVFPSSRIDSVSKLFIFKIFWQINEEKFMHIAIINIFAINWYGLSTLFPEKCEVYSLKQ